MSGDWIISIHLLGLSMGFELEKVTQRTTEFSEEFFPCVLPVILCVTL